MFFGCSSVEYFSINPQSNLCSTVVLSPLHTFYLRPSGFEPSRCSRCPEATSPATGKPHGSYPPGTTLPGREVITSLQVICQGKTVYIRLTQTKVFKPYLAGLRCTGLPAGRAESWPGLELWTGGRTRSPQSHQMCCSAGKASGWSWIYLDLKRETRNQHVMR